MAIQYHCEVCDQSYPETTMMIVDLTGKITCPVCINILITNLAQIVSDYATNKVCKNDLCNS